MTNKEIQLLLESNNIKNVHISAAPMASGKWIVEFERTTGGIVALTARRENIRQFANLETAIKTLKEIGIRRAHIDWSSHQ